MAAIVRIINALDQFPDFFLWQENFEAIFLSTQWNLLSNFGNPTRSSEVAAMLDVAGPKRPCPVRLKDLVGIWLEQLTVLVAISFQLQQPSTLALYPIYLPALFLT